MAARDQYTATIDWAQGAIEFSNVATASEAYLDENGLYCVLSGERSSRGGWQDVTLLYIGKAWGQTLRKRIPQAHPAHTCASEYLDAEPGRVPLIMVGVVIEHSMECLSAKFFGDIETALINANKPLCNTASIVNYTGRELQVTNIGDHKPLAKYCLCTCED